MTISVILHIIWTGFKAWHILPGCEIIETADTRKLTRGMMEPKCTQVKLKYAKLEQTSFVENDKKRAEHDEELMRSITGKHNSIKEKVEQCKRLVGSYAQWIKENEPTTLSYQLMQSDKDPLQVCILERYADKSDAYAIAHKTSPEFFKFRPALAALGLGRCVARRLEGAAARRRLRVSFCSPLGRLVVGRVRAGQGLRKRLLGRRIGHL